MINERYGQSKFLSTNLMKHKLFAFLSRFRKLLNKEPNAEFYTVKIKIYLHICMIAFALFQ